MKIRFFLSAQVFLFLALAFLLAFVAPLAVDDWSFYHFVEGGSDSKILNLVASLREFYFTWGGRVLAQLMAIVILRTGPDLLFPFVVVGSFALFLVWFLRIAGHPLASVKSSLAPLLILGVGVFGIGIFLKVPLQTIYWITGAGSYLLTSVLMVAFVLKEHNFLFVGTESKRGVLSLAASCLLAFLAGAAFEVVGPSLLGLMLYQWG
ncbi:MAG: DUF6056 family protein, partial [Bdellovibrionaceae bacterium]|nr:DUF6056 family protein [Pseudobdellovibrionaceae bacterium]